MSFLDALYLDAATYHVWGANRTDLQPGSGTINEAVAQQAAEHGIELSVVEHHQAKRGFVLLPHSWGGAAFRCMGWAVSKAGPGL